VLDILVFDDAGEIVRAIHMGPSGIAPTLCYRLNASLYHALLPRTPFVAFHETTAGPFRKDEAQFAPWAPDEPVKLRGFLEDKLRRFRIETGMRHGQVQRS
jgi:hypothetical protein